MTSPLHAVPLDSGAPWTPAWVHALHAPPPANAPAAPAQSSSSGLPEPWEPWFRLVLDAIDYGVALLRADGRLLYANAAMFDVLDAGLVLRVDAAHQVRATLPADELRFVEARHAACDRGLRRLVQLGRHARTVVLVGLGGVGGVGGVGGGRPGADQPCLLMASRPAPCERLSIDLYAKLHGLTSAEAQVLSLLAEGLRPAAIALRQGVRISTVRTQIGSIRSKTEERSMVRLMQRLSTLPPIVNALRRGAPSHAGEARGAREAGAGACSGFATAAYLA